MYELCSLRRFSFNSSFRLGIPEALRVKREGELHLDKKPHFQLQTYNFIGRSKVAPMTKEDNNMKNKFCANGLRRWPICCRNLWLNGNRPWFHCIIAMIARMTDHFIGDHTPVAQRTDNSIQQIKLTPT